MKRRNRHWSDTLVVLTATVRRAKARWAKSPHTRIVVWVSLTVACAYNTARGAYIVLLYAVATYRHLTAGRPETSTMHLAVGLVFYLVGSIQFALWFWACAGKARQEAE